MKKGSFFKTQKLFFLSALIISLVFFDQFSKYLIEANFNLYESTNIIPLLNFTFIKNFGGAFFGAFRQICGAPQFQTVTHTAFVSECRQ